MKNNPNSPSNNPRKTKRLGPKTRANTKPWVIAAINEEAGKPSDQIWKNEPSAEYREAERLKLIRFCRKHAQAHLELDLIADCLENCEPNNRCCSGACPECGRLFQRFYVRNSKNIIRDIIANEGIELIAICIIPSSPLVRPGQLNRFSIINFQRRIKTALDSVGIKSAIGGIDISFNEDRENKWPPYICLHPYLIAATDERKQLRRELKKIFPKTTEVPRPIKLPLFENKASRRSYSQKITFNLRISHYKIRKGQTTKCRNTSIDKLRVDQRIELYKYLHQIGLAARVVFRGTKPQISKSKVRFRKA